MTFLETKFGSLNQTKNYWIRLSFSTKILRLVCKESFRPGLSLKPGLKPENGFKLYAYKKTQTEFRFKPNLFNFRLK